MEVRQSQKIFENALRYIPGGVNSPVRAFKAVGGHPLFIKKAKGAYLFDEDNNRYVDYVGSWGPMILGHAHPAVINAVIETAQLGLSFGAPTQLEVDLAKKIIAFMPNLEQVRLVNSGTEATMTALRLARAITGRNKIMKFDGCYHGHNDSLLVNAGSGALTLGIPSSPGVPEDFAKHTLTALFNDFDSVEKLFVQHGKDLAAVIIEPVAGNMNCILPRTGFLQQLQQICHQYGTLLIFDEVMTGFRVAKGGAQSLYKIKPDLTTLGKIIGGGMPVGAVAGKKELMEMIAPIGSVYQAGTLSGNPVAMAAGLATLEELDTPGFYEKLFENMQYFLIQVKERAAAAKIPLQVNAAGALFGLVFADQGPITSLNEVKNSNIQKFNQFFHLLLQQGVYLPPSGYEAMFFSAAHQEAEIKFTVKAMETAFNQLKP
jgi:glutamate-1-semialdehyde 2,1-aminomutase